MTRRGLLLRNLVYHWRGNSAVFLGVVVGTAVLTGALLVGDSLRGSLRELTLRRLGWVDHALLSGRMIRADLAERLQADAGAERVCPVILLQGGASRVAAAGEAEASTGPRRVGRVVILGVDERFWPGGAAPAGDGVVLSAALARELGAEPGQTIALDVQKRSDVPRESLLGRRDDQDVVAQLRLTVGAVLPDDHFGSRFSLMPAPSAPRNAFVPLRELHSALSPQPRGKPPAPVRVNALLAQGGTAEALQASLRQHLDLSDWGLEVHVRPEPGYLGLQSKQLLIEPAVEQAALAAAQECGLQAAPTLVYLANTVTDGVSQIPYAIVAALDPTLPHPLGPFLPPGKERLQDDEICLADWKESPLRARPGSPIELAYFEPQDQGGLKEKTATFIFAGRVPLEGVAADRHLTPEFPGITDKTTVREWKPPFPFDETRIKPNDINERFWLRHRATPKAYVTPAAGRRLWGNRFGDATSIRLAPAAGADLKQARERFTAALQKQLRPEQGGLVFDPVRQRGLDASTGGTDFGPLFLGFSFFLIVAALLLVGLLFRLNLDRRASEIGLLLAAGYRQRTVRAPLLGEGLVFAAVGAAVGCAVAVGYAGLLLGLLRKLWPGGLEQSFLQLYVAPVSFLYGCGGALLMSFLAIAWAVRSLSRIPPAALLAGETTAAAAATGSAAPRWSRWIAVAAAVLALMAVAVTFFVSDHEAQAMTFFAAGMLALTAGLAAVWAWMRGSRHGRIQGRGSVALARLGVRNAARYPVRSLLTAGLLAAAAFLLIAVESFRREPGADFANRHGGSGGFPLLAESDLPVFQNLNDDPGRFELNFPEPADNLLKGVTVYSMPLRAGDDASCLNLYKPNRPRLLGVPHALVERGGFHFAATEKAAGNPWTLLEERRDDGAVPVFGEANTVQWMLHSGLGQEIEVPDERGRPVKLRIVGLFKDSFFQSELLLSQAAFRRLYPGQEGYNYFLIDAPPERVEEVRELLETTLAKRGFEATPTAERLASYLAVENTYLSTFQVLGGLGLLLGSLGLAVVLLRSVWERRGGLALLRALGYRHRALGWLVLAENGFLLALGLGVGVLAALLAVAPHLAGGQGHVPWLRLFGMLALTLAAGLAAGAAAVAATLRAPLLPALRRE